MRRRDSTVGLGPRQLARAGDGCGRYRPGLGAGTMREGLRGRRGGCSVRTSRHREVPHNSNYARTSGLVASCTPAGPRRAAAAGTATAPPATTLIQTLSDEVVAREERPMRRRLLPLLLNLTLLALIPALSPAQGIAHASPLHA